MKLIVKHSTVAKVAKITKDMDTLMDSLLGTNRVNSEYYADPVKDFNKTRKNKVFNTLGKATRFTNDPETKEMTIEINPKLVEDMLDASHTLTKTLVTVTVPLFKVHATTMKNIAKKYKLK